MQTMVYLLKRTPAPFFHELFGRGEFYFCLGGLICLWFMQHAKYEKKRRKNSSYEVKGLFNWLRLFAELTRIFF